MAQGFRHHSLSLCVWLWFNLGSSIASKIKSALFFCQLRHMGVKLIRIDPLEPNIWLYCLYCGVLAAVFNPKVWSARELLASSILSSNMGALCPAHPPTHLDEAHSIISIVNKPYRQPSSVSTFITDVSVLLLLLFI